MNKFQFLEKLRARLSGLSKEDLSLSEEYYGEMIDDRIEEGMSEEDAVAALGSLDAIVKQILRETPLRRIVKEKVKTRRHLRAFILMSPIKNHNVLKILHDVFPPSGLFEFVQQDIYKNTQDQRTGNGGDDHLSDGQRHSAHTGDQNYRYGEEIGVILQVHLLNHLQTRNRDKAVQGDANAAHDAPGDRIQKGDEGRNKGD